jgi:hypothetical protein
MRTLMRTGLFVKIAIGKAASFSRASGTPGHAQVESIFTVFVIGEKKLQCSLAFRFPGAIA